MFNKSSAKCQMETQSVLSMSVKSVNKSHSPVTLPNIGKCKLKNSVRKKRHQIRGSSEPQRWSLIFFSS